MSAENEKTVHGYMAEFDSVPTLLAACRRVRDAGYTKTDAYTPFPVHGIDEALGIKPTALPWIALAAGLSGTTIALVMQIWMNGIDYPYIISGKPYISLPAFIPVSFELTILLASFGAFFGMLALNRLPRFSNPIFTNSRFDAATDDKFFLYIDAADPRYDAQGVANLLGEMEPLSVDPVVDDNSSDKLPRPFLAIVATAALLATVPALLVARMRVTTSGSPRFHVFYDMDFSPAKHTQKVTTLFADGRTMRPDVAGTVARSQGDYDVDFLTGIDMQQLALLDPQRAQRLVRFVGQPPSEEPASEEPPSEEPPAEEPPSEEPPSEEPPSEEPPSEEPPSEEPPAEEPPAEEPPAEEPPAEEPPSDEPPAEEPPAEEPPAEEPPSEEPTAEETAADQPPTDEPAAGEPAAQDAPATEQPPAAEPAAQEPAAEDAPAEEADPQEPSVEEPPAEEPASAETADGQAAAGGEEVVDNTPWLADNPLPINRDTLLLGQQQFNIYCAVCHGQDGQGNGLVAARAQTLMESNWVPPSSLHQEAISKAKYPDGKLFSTISNGIRKMPGYAGQIKVRDRWAIVAYVRALQLSRNASESDVPEGMRDQIPAVAAQPPASEQDAAGNEAEAAAE